MARSKARWERVQSWPRLIRILLAGASVVGVISAVLVTAFMGDTEFRRNADLVQTQPREEATFVEEVPVGRNGRSYYVQLHGKEVKADYGWLIPDPVPGATVEVVQDPDDPDRVVAVGTPKDWLDDPQMAVALWAIALVLGLITSVVAGIKFLPEYADPVLMKFFDWVARLMR
jgi:hypothetical protein